MMLKAIWVLHRWTDWSTAVAQLFTPGIADVIGVLCQGGVFYFLHGRPAPGSTAKLCHANLQGADLTRANLASADLEGADLSSATLIGARLERAVLRWARLAGARMRDIRLVSAVLDGADLRWADLTGADLRLASLSGADLRQANLRRSDLICADLRNADLRSADLRARLDGVKLTGARYDDATRWPASFQPERHGAVMATEVVPVPLPQGRGDEAAPTGLHSAGREGTG